jgi:hypothetical protein
VNTAIFAIVIFPVIHLRSFLVSNYGANELYQFLLLEASGVNVIFRMACDIDRQKRTSGRAHKQIWTTGKQAVRLRAQVGLNGFQEAGDAR